MNIAALAPEQFAAALAADGVAIRTGPFVSRIAARLPELAPAVQFLYGDFAFTPDAPVDFEARIELAAGLRGRLWPKVYFRGDGAVPFYPFPRRLGLALLEWGLNWCIWGQPQRYLVIHAAAVARDGRAALLPGDAGAGKSTLTAALIARGWRLMSDELTLLDMERRELLPLARPVSLKNDSIGIIRGFAPDAAFGPVLPDTRKGTVSHMRPPPDSVRHSAEPARPAWIVFPNYTPSARLAERAEPKARALARLGDQAINRTFFGADGFEALVWLIDSADCTTLTYSSLDDAVAWFDARP